MMPALSDTYGRPLRNLRISVTDRCSLRCSYCMPEQDYVWLPHDQALRFEEIRALLDVFVTLGVDKVRLTGGEPLVRRDLPVLVGLIAGQPALRDIALTTNGVLLERFVEPLFDAGLHRITVSLDTLRRDRFRELARRDELDTVLAGIAAAARAGAARSRRGLKLDSVVLRGVNDDEMFDLLAYARGVGAELRFIEYMDVGGATQWSPERVVPRAEMLERLAARLGPIEALPAEGSAPAARFRLPDGQVFGIVSSTTEPFCARCDRARLTADGRLFFCLYGRTGLDLRGPLRAGASPEEIAALIAPAWAARRDRGAEERLRLVDRAPLAPAAELRRDPHLEMHTRGG